MAGSNGTSGSPASWFRRIIITLAVVIVVVAWFAGISLEEADLSLFLKQALPNADRFERIRSGCFAAWKGNEGGKEQLLGYVSIGEANGYGGPIKVAVAVDRDGKTIGVSIVSQKETPSFLRQVLGNDMMESLVGKSYGDPFRIGVDIDGVTGATYTARALAEAAREASRDVAEFELDRFVPSEVSPRLVFGVPEITLIILYGLWWISHGRRFRLRKAVRWASLLAGMMVFGFLYNNPLTLAFVDKLLLGYWPEWQTHLYLYLLVGGMLLLIAVENKNPYCNWVCPFGAVQECLAAVGGAKVNIQHRYRMYLRRVQRTVAWAAIVLALLFRNPGISSYEIFGTFFSLTGSSIQFGLLVLVLVLAMFVKRPWCNFLCPIRPVEDFLRRVRRWTKGKMVRVSPEADG